MQLQHRIHSNDLDYTGGFSDRFLAVVVIIMVIKGVMRTVSILQEKKQKKLLEKQKQQEETREQIRLEERNKLEAIESL